MNDFWHKLHKPFFVMAPMEDVTDVAFRQMFAKYSNSSFEYVTFTEFVSADGLMLSEGKSRRRLMNKLRFFENERPIVAQIFGGNAEHIKRAAFLIAKLRFDGIDLNMGCPDKSVEKQCAGAALIKNKKLAQEIIRSAKSAGLPTSVKTRIGYKKEEVFEWLPVILEERVSAITIHLRTRNEMSKVPAHWDVMHKIIKLRDKISPSTLIIGNGDVKSVEDAKTKAEKYGCDGIMFGRALFGKPDFFSYNIVEDGPIQPQLQRRRIEMLMEHIELFDKLLLRNEYKGYDVMKKHFKAYIAGWKGAKEERCRLMNTNDIHDAKRIIKEYLL